MFSRTIWDVLTLNKYMIIVIIFLYVLCSYLPVFHVLGFNYQFGINYIRDYSVVSSVCVNLVRDGHCLLVVLIHLN